MHHLGAIVRLPEYFSRLQHLTSAWVDVCSVQDFAADYGKHCSSKSNDSDLSQIRYLVLPAPLCWK